MLNRCYPEEEDMTIPRAVLIFSFQCSNNLNPSQFYGSLILHEQERTLLPFSSTAPVAIAVSAAATVVRNFLPRPSTDKTSLLAEVIQHVKELKRQTLEITKESPLPTEADELTVDAANNEEGGFLVRASLCCDDRSDLLPYLIKAIEALKLRILKAKITTLGGRIRNMLMITEEDGAEQHCAEQPKRWKSFQGCRERGSFKDGEALMQVHILVIALGFTAFGFAIAVAIAIERRRSNRRWVALWQLGVEIGQAFTLQARPV
ncbi:hypothetical protein Cni_G13927 [Canna indica]|uniref:Uncharacterized protein n=1 Tax=Canna indica TaxID=4628 RepID=A0AAQ3KB26_9LILI|nr:hypothetical protein Cni_G13927 [Canna indica]